MVDKSVRIDVSAKIAARFSCPRYKENTVERVRRSIRYLPCLWKIIRQQLDCKAFGKKWPAFVRSVPADGWENLTPQDAVNVSPLLSVYGFGAYDYVTQRGSWVVLTQAG